MARMMGRNCLKNCRKGLTTIMKNVLQKVERLYYNGMNLKTVIMLVSYPMKNLISVIHHHVKNEKREISVKSL